MSFRCSVQSVYMCTHTGAPLCTGRYSVCYCMSGTPLCLLVWRHLCTRADAVHHTHSVQAKDKMLMETLETISRHRKEKTKAAVERYVQSIQYVYTYKVSAYHCQQYHPPSSLRSCTPTSHHLPLPNLL